MNIEELVEYINRITPSRLVRFVSEQSENSCRDCLKHHNQIFEENDKDRPELPIHPNCRCKYELLTQEEVTAYQDDLQKIKTQLINYGNQIAAQATQLLAECDEEIKTHTVTQTSNAVVTALPTVYQTMKVLEKGKALEEKLNSTVASAKLNTIVTALQIGLWTMKKIEQADNFLQKKMESIGINTVLDELTSWLLPMQRIENSLKKWHYDRLNNPMQQPWALPQSPEEAIRRGFVRAPDNQNLYHRNKGQKDNVKYHSPETGQEVIFNGQGKIVTDVENIGTYNYFPVSESISINNFLHVVADVLPYYKWGNDEKDTTSLGNRLLGPENGPFFDLCLMILKIIDEFEKNNFQLEK